MSSIVANSTLELNQVNRLLEKRVPSYRQAYSDRTAWIMACMSELAYIKFNPIFSNEKHKSFFLENVTKLAGENKKSSLIKLIDIVGYDHEAEKEKLQSELATLKMELIETFDSNGTQAILVSHESFIVLAFRGTEATSIKDIKSDANAKSIACETEGKIHTGFRDAYDEVALDIQKKLDSDEFKDTPLFITGHSLGGALATIAAKKLTHQGGLAACYTFGAPRVGDEDWIENIKTPIYRVVNSADCVTMLPPGDESISIVSWIIQFVPYFGKQVRRWLLSKFGGYLHCGNMRYLTNCPSGQYTGVKLLYSVSLFRRIKGLIIKKLPWKSFLADHSISIYRKKLTMIAQNKNPSA